MDRERWKPFSTFFFTHIATIMLLLSSCDPFWWGTIILILHTAQVTTVSLSFGVVYTCD